MVTVPIYDRLFCCNMLFIFLSFNATIINLKAVSPVLNFHNFNPKHFIFALSCCKSIFSLMLVILHTRHIRYIASILYLTNLYKHHICTSIYILVVLYTKLLQMKQYLQLLHLHCFKFNINYHDSTQYDIITVCVSISRVHLIVV